MTNPPTPDFTPSEIEQETKIANQAIEIDDLKAKIAEYERVLREIAKYTHQAGVQAIISTVGLPEETE
jgi:hypothetical protein